MPNFWTSEYPYEIPSTIQITSPPLQASFALGWRSLPTELQVEILSYIIPRKTAVTGAFLDDCTGPYTRERHGHGWYLTSWLSSFINVADFTDIALDLLLSHGTVHINAESDKKVFHLITPFAHRIQHLKVVVYTVWHNWNWLAGFMSGAFGGHRLHSMELIITGSRTYGHAAQLFMEEIEATEPVVIKTKKLTLSSENWEAGGGSRLDYKCLPDTDELTELIMKKLIRDSQ